MDSTSFIQEKTKKHQKNKKKKDETKVCFGFLVVFLYYKLGKKFFKERLPTSTSTNTWCDPKNYRSLKRRISDPLQIKKIESKKVFLNKLKNRSTFNKKEITDNSLIFRARKHYLESY